MKNKAQQADDGSLGILNVVVVVVVAAVAVAVVVVVVVVVIRGALRV